MGKGFDRAETKLGRDAWSIIRAYHLDGKLIRLRVAANLVGLSEFPIGWSWTEYEAHCRADRMPYEKQIIALQRSNIGIGTTSNVDGRFSQQYAVGHRKRKVKKILGRLIRNRVFRYELGRNFYAHEDVKTKRATFVHRDLRDYECARLDIELSRVAVYSLYRGTEITVHPGELINYLTQRETRGRAPGADWAWIESKARAHIEHSGFPPRLADLQDELHDQYRETFPDHPEPRDASLTSLLRKLRREYKAK